MSNSKQKWSCLAGCGACCRLAPDERIEALEALDDHDAETYIKMVGKDGWCVHYDQRKRICTIYSDRPAFCRVSNMADFFQIDPSQFDAFAIRCCYEQIESTFGCTSDEYTRFDSEFTYPSRSE